MDRIALGGPVAAWEGTVAAWEGTSLAAQAPRPAQAHQGATSPCCDVESF